MTKKAQWLAQEWMRKQVDPSMVAPLIEKTPEDEAYGWLGELFAVMKALYLSHWDAHWKVMGDSFYGDHLLFSRMYEGLVEEIDTLAEKINATV